jgi:hypothetical protein
VTASPSTCLAHFPFDALFFLIDSRCSIAPRRLDGSNIELFHRIIGSIARLVTA